MILSVEGIHAFIYCTKWRSGQLLLMPDWLFDSLTTLKDSATQLLIKYKSGALVTQWALGFKDCNEHLSHVRGKGGLEKRLMAYMEYLQNKNKVSNIRHRENPNRFLTLVAFDCCCKCSTYLMISVIVQAKSSKGNPNESWETLRYTV